MEICVQHLCPYHFLLVTHCLQIPNALSLVPDDGVAQECSDWLIALAAGLHLLVMSYSVLAWKLNATAETAGDVELNQKRTLVLSFSKKHLKN